MSTPKPRTLTARHAIGTPEVVVGPLTDRWKPLEAVPGYWISTDGHVCREIKVRTNKNGTRWARVSIKGRQHVIRV